MTIDEAIKHAEEVAEEQEKAAKEWHERQVRKCELIPFAEMDYTNENECKECAEEYRQLAEWLKELKQLREQTRWFPINERLPEDGLYLVTTSKGQVQVHVFNHNGNSEEYWMRCNKAWMPLPEPYKASPTAAESEDKDKK